VLVMGKNVFTQMSGARVPLRDALAQALNRRAADVWKDRPQVYEFLHRISVRALMEPVPQPLLTPATTMREVGQLFVEHGNEFFFISSDGQTIEGVVTITDLLRGQGNGANRATPVSEFMTKNPVTIAADDTCAVAATALREYRLKSLPVVEDKAGRRLLGCLRIRKLMAFVLKETADEAG
jgi:NADH:ubiquinone reductase (H+-translocating)